MDVDTIRDLVQIITIYDSRPEDFYRLGLEKRYTLNMIKSGNTWIHGTLLDVSMHVS